MLLLRAWLAFLLLPGIVAFAVPAWLAYGLAPAQGLGLLPLVLGITVLLSCVMSFYQEGRGTLAPWSPPRHLVTGGLYRWSRNPMYVGVLLIRLGWALLYASWLLAAYAAVVSMAFYLRVLFGEEPVLARSFGEEWQAYCRRTPRWLGRKHE